MTLKKSPSGVFKHLHMVRVLSWEPRHRSDLRDVRFPVGASMLLMTYPRPTAHKCFREERGCES